MNVGAGKSLVRVVTVKLPPTPTVNAVLAALVKAGAWSIVRTKFWVADGLTPLDATKATR